MSDTHADAIRIAVHTLPPEEAVGRLVRGQGADGDPDGVRVFVRHGYPLASLRASASSAAVLTIFGNWTIWSTF